ncbi:MAG: hypothetical protein E7560_02340 [Ruminococcaceae bacterium]|nr:hypothetical protein [Oscillospiraceae bacterium]
MRFKRITKILPICLVLAFIVMIILNPQVCKAGVTEGILLCGRVVIPSLFPFTVLVIFLLKIGLADKLSFLNRLTQFILGLNANEFFVMFMSFVGGYPIGAKLINEAVKNSSISPRKAKIMLNYCVNAGPAFIIGAIGNAILGAKILGNILFVSHILSSLLIAMFFRFFNKCEENEKRVKTISYNIADSFTLSVSDAAASMISICAFVIFFFCVTAYLDSFAAEIPFLNSLVYFLEITNAVNRSNNLYFISFLLGFGGISVWCQIFSSAKEIKVNYTQFILCRIIHGLISSLITYIQLKIFHITVPTLSNGKVFSFSYLHSTPSVTISMVIMCLVFILSLKKEKSIGKLLCDMV